MNTFGLIGLMVIVFAECGLLVGFFLPGDTLLFSAGLLASVGTFKISFWVLVLCVPTAAVLGNLAGYWIGYTAGPAEFNRPNSRLFKQEYVDRSHAFFERYGAATVVVARFVPIVRTFATVMAGASRMRFRLYAVYSLIGGFMWGGGVIAISYYLGRFSFVRDTVRPLLEPAVIAVVLLSLLPTGIHLLRTRRRPTNAERSAEGLAAEPTRMTAEPTGMTAEPLVADPITTAGTAEHGRHRAD